MTLDELASSLPNGLHDARLLRLSIDHVLRIATPDPQIDVSTTDSQANYRDARITLSGLVFCAVDPPDGRYPFDAPGPLTIDVGEGEPSTCAAVHPAVPTDAFLAWIFGASWNSFVHISARESALSSL